MRYIIITSYIKTRTYIKENETSAKSPGLLCTLLHGPFLKERGIIASSR